MATCSARSHDGQSDIESVGRLSWTHSVYRILSRVFSSFFDSHTKLDSHLFQHKLPKVPKSNFFLHFLYKWHKVFRCTII